MTDTPENRPDQPADHVAATATPDALGAPPGEKRHPWARYWAKILDMGLFSLILGIPIAILGVDGHVADLLGWAMFAALYPPVEGLIIARTGGTPGKALFNILVTTESGEKLDTKTSIIRSFHCLLVGLAAAIPFLSFAAMLWFGYRDYAVKGVTLWDRQAGAYYSARPTGKSWIVLCIIGLVLFVLLFMITAASMMQE